MADDVLGQMRAEARDIFTRSIKAVDPYEAVKRFVRVSGGAIEIGPQGGDIAALDLASFDRILVVGGGKATAPMAKAIEEIFGAHVERGLINVKYGFTEELDRIELVEAGHPLPDAAGVEGTRRILEILNMATEKDLVFSLISGGGSALLVQPASGIHLEDKQALTKSLLACGANIDEINSIRKHISASKGGQMARAAYPATVVNLMLSDVVGDRMDVIASGPFVPDTSTFADALRVVAKYNLQDIPSAIAEHIRNGTQGHAPETPKDGDVVFDRVHNVIVGSNMLALEAAADRAELLGYRTLILSSMIEGETSDVARVHTGIAREMLASGRPLAPPACIISGGECTVTIRGDGMGGRNQEFALAAALDLAGLPPRVVLLSGATDGNDGPTDAAGGLADPLTVARAAEAGLDPLAYLADNDSYHFLEKVGDLLKTGPTRTNVMDVRLVLVR